MLGKALTAAEMLKRLYDGERLIPGGGKGLRPYFESGIAKVATRQVTILERAGLIELLYSDKGEYATGQRYIISEAGREKVQRSDGATVGKAAVT